VNIKKQLRFLYRYLTTSRRWRNWISAQVLIVLAASAIFFTALAWSTPRSAIEAQAKVDAVNSTSATQSLTPNPSSGPTKTPFPAEYLANGQQTIGITLAGVILVLIVVVGVIVFMPKNGKK
jgi:hypothetical protein